MEKAVERILKAKENNERVVVFWDYDVDGVSSTAMLVRFFSEIGIQTSYRLPHRVHDGYGMKKYFMDELKEKNVTLVVSVDCGTRDVEVVKHAKWLWIDIIITDHHAVPEKIPEEVIALLNPKLSNSTYPFDSLSGSGVAFKLLTALACRLFEWKKLEDTILSFIDFAALWTVSDMMPLVDENRTIVTLWLGRLQHSKSSGIRKLIEGKESGNADIIGFHIGPRINAAGRMDSAYTALKLLLASEANMDSILAEIESLNSKRRFATEEFVKKALSEARESDPVIFFVSDEIEHGIIGLVAGRLMEAFGKPVIALKKDKDAYVASARAPEGFHLSEALDTMKECFIAYGGHAQAAGFTLKRDSYKEFVSRFTAFVQSHPISNNNSSRRSKNLCCDGELPLSECTKAFVRKLRDFGPYGIGFEKPKFLVTFDRVPECKYLGDGEKHVAFLLPKGYKLVGFGLGEHFKTFRTHTGKVRFLVELAEETWRGFTSISLQIKDIVLE